MTSIAQLIEAFSIELDGKLTNTEKTALVALSFAQPVATVQSAKAILDANPGALNSVQSVVGVGVGIVFANNKVTDITTGVILVEKWVANEAVKQFKVSADEEPIVEILVQTLLTNTITQAVTAAFKVAGTPTAVASMQPLGG